MIYITGDTHGTIDIEKLKYDTFISKDDYLIIDELNTEKYAERIIEIIKEEKIQTISKQVFEHFLHNYTQKVVFENTLRIYEKILRCRI